MLALGFVACNYLQEWKLDKKSSDIYTEDGNNSNNAGNIAGAAASESVVADEEAPLLPSSRFSYTGRSQVSSHKA